MRKFLLAIALLLTASQGVYATTRSGPFSLPFLYAAPSWRIALPERFEHQDRVLISSIADEVKRKPEKDWLTWTNQLVNVRVGALNPSNNCTILAVAKYEVILLLIAEKDPQFAIDEKEGLLFVVGRNALDPKTKDLHAMLAVLVGGSWQMLDNGSYTPKHRVLDDSKITKRFQPLYILK